MFRVYVNVLSRASATGFSSNLSASWLQDGIPWDPLGIFCRLPRELIIREASDEAALPCRGVGHLRDG